MTNDVGVRLAEAVLERLKALGWFEPRAVFGNFPSSRQEIETVSYKVRFMDNRVLVTLRYQQENLRGGYVSFVVTPSELHLPPLANRTRGIHYTKRSSADAYVEPQALALLLNLISDAQLTLGIPLGYQYTLSFDLVRKLWQESQIVPSRVKVN